MRNKLALTFITAVLVAVSPVSAFFLVKLQPVSAAVSDLEAEKKKLEEEAKKKAAQAAVEAAQAKESEQKIERAEEQIGDLQASIGRTNGEINSTQTEIDKQTQDIAGMESDLRKSMEIQNSVVREVYMKAQGAREDLRLFANRSVSEEERDRAQYIALKEMLSKIIAVTTEKKLAVEKTRNDLTQKATTLTNLRDQQSEQKTGLAIFQDIQIQAKEDHEAAKKRLQSEVAASQAKIAKIESQISAALSAAISKAGIGQLNGIHVERGQVIGHRGSTGYSTGPHVHLEVRLDNSPVNPAPYLANGTLAYPVSRYTITQGFGYTDYAQSGAYGGSIHTGIDLAGPQGDSVMASASGTVILNQYYGGYGNAIAIRLDSNPRMVVLYGHMTGK